MFDSGTIWNSNTLLNSQSYDALAYLRPLLDKRIDAKQAAAWTALLAAGTVGKTTVSTTGVTYLELLAWQHSVPVANRGTGCFILSDGLLQAIRGLLDSQNRPIYQESLSDAAPDKLLGWPIFPSADLVTPAANAVSGVAVSAELLFVRDVSNRRITRYVNQPNWGDQFGVREFVNGDFKIAAGGVRKSF